MIRKLFAAFQVTLDLLTDSIEYLRDQSIRRRMSVNATSHRWNGEVQRTVWHMLDRDEDTCYIQQVPGRHADRRGWRYSPKVWHLVTRLRDERAAFDRAREDVWRLLNEMREMIMFPPNSATESEHGCNNCTCNAVSSWRGLAA